MYMLGENITRRDFVTLKMQSYDLVRFTVGKR